MRKEQFYEVFLRIFESVRDYDFHKQEELIKEYPWSKRWLGRTSENAHLETVVMGADPKWDEKEGTCEIRKERGYRPLLSIFVTTSTGVIFFNLEPEGQEEYMIRT